MHDRSLTLFALALLTAACGAPAPRDGNATGAERALHSTPHPADEFLTRIRQHCGQTFAGTIVANDPQPENDPFVGKALRMHVRDCGQLELQIPFAVGDDRSRTWLLTRTPEGLRLKHDHRHEDGTEDALTMYGGETTTPGTPERQEFPVDDFSKALFLREGLSVSVTNTWAMEIVPHKLFAYELTRPGRTFRVEFDLTTPLP